MTDFMYRLSPNLTIYKKGDPQLLDNYRPISTLPIFSKIFEKLIYTRIYDFLVAKNVLYEKQFGFRRNHSTSHAIKGAGGSSSKFSRN